MNNVNIKLTPKEMRIDTAAKALEAAFNAVPGAASSVCRNAQKSDMGSYRVSGAEMCDLMEAVRNWNQAGEDLIQAQLGNGRCACGRYAQIIDYRSSGDTLKEHACRLNRNISVPRP